VLPRLEKERRAQCFAVCRFWGERLGIFRLSLSAHGVASARREAQGSITGAVDKDISGNFETVIGAQSVCYDFLYSPVLYIRTCNHRIEHQSQIGFLATKVVEAEIHHGSGSLRIADALI
jgi:hypothetical protein